MILRWSHKISIPFNYFGIKHLPPNDDHYYHALHAASEQELNRN